MTTTVKGYDGHVERMTGDHVSEWRSAHSAYLEGLKVKCVAARKRQPRDGSAGDERVGRMETKLAGLLQAATERRIAPCRS